MLLKRLDSLINSYNAEFFLFQPCRLKVVFLIRNYLYFNCFSAGIVFIRQNLTSTDFQILTYKEGSRAEGLIFLGLVILYICMCKNSSY